MRPLNCITTEFNAKKYFICYRVEIPLSEKEDELLGLKEDDESDSTKGMSRASSPVGDSKTESKQRRIESRLENDDEIQKTASDLAAKIINLAIEEIASGSSPEALAEEIFLENEEKTENVSENIETLDNFHTDDDQIATVNIEIKNKNLIENWDANEGEARPFGLERASYLNEKNDIKAQKEITIDLDGVIANDSHVFINQVPIFLHFPISSLMVYEQGYNFFTGLSCKETNFFDRKLP